MIILKGTKKADDQKSWIFVTLTVDGDECNFIHTAPANLAGQALQDYIDAREDSYRLDILKDMYPGSIFGSTVGDFTDWIIAGRKNPDTIDADDKTIIGEVIEKVPFASNHDALYDVPLNRKDISQETKDAYATIKADYLAATTDAERIPILLSAIRELAKIILGKDLG